MSISVTVRKAGPFNGNGVTTVFAFAFKVFSTSDLLVIATDANGAETNLALTTHYSVSLNADQDLSPGGTVTCLAAPATGTILTLSSNVAYTQTLKLTNAGGFYPESINNALDRAVILIQQLQEQVGRSLKNSISAPIGINSTLPAPSPYQVLSWNGTGTGLENTDPTYSTVLATDLASTVTNKGSALVGFKQAVTGAIARTVHKKLGDVVSVKDFGAVGDGVTNDTAAFNAAIAYANSRGGIDFLNIVGTTILIPDGRYVLGALNNITRSGCEFVGASRNGTVLLCTPGTKTFNFGDGVNIVVGGGISNLKVEYLLTVTVGTIFCGFDYAYRVMLSNILVANIGVLCRLGETNTRPAGGIVLNNIDGSKANVAIPLFDVRFGAGLFLNQVHVFIPVGVPVHPASMTTVANCSVFNCIIGFWDTLQATNCIFERFYNGLAITAASGMVYQNFYFSNTIMDYLRNYCVYAESQSGGVVSGIRFDAASWFVSWESDAIALSGAGYNDNHHFSGKVVIAGSAGVNYALASSRNVVFDHMQLNSCNRLGTANGAMVFGASSGGFTVSGCKGNIDTTAIGFAWRAPYGVSVGANSDRYMVTGCAFEGSSGAMAVAGNASGSAYRKIFNNTNANYAGTKVQAVPASTVRYTNTTPFVEEWTFFGGTITSGYDKNLEGFPGALQYVHFRLQPNDSFAVGYSVAPTIKVFVEP